MIQSRAHDCGFEKPISIWVEQQTPERAPSAGLFPLAKAERKLQANLGVRVFDKDCQCIHQLRRILSKLF